MNDEKIAKIARDLSEALQDWYYTRKIEDKKRVNDLHQTLVTATKAEKETV